MRDDDVRSACFAALDVLCAQWGRMMPELLKRFDRQAIVVPHRRASQPDRERLAVRFERFLARTE